MKRATLMAALAAGIVTIALGFGARATQAATAVTADAGGLYRGLAGESIQFAGTSSTGINLGFYWEFGDGANDSGVIANHVYSSAGVYTVTLTVTDAYGQTARATTTATIGGGGAVNACAFSQYGQMLCSAGSAYYWPAGARVACTYTVHGPVCPSVAPINCYGSALVAAHCTSNVSVPMHRYPISGSTWAQPGVQLLGANPVCALPWRAGCGLLRE
jgi:hypothetical protein